MKLTHEHEEPKAIAWDDVKDGWAVWTGDELYIPISPDDHWWPLSSSTEAFKQSDMIGQLVEITEVKFR